MIMKRATEVLRAATDQLDELDIRYAVEIGRHLKLRWTHAGRGRMYVMPLSPSDYRITRKIRCEVRKMLRRDGFAI